MFEVDPADLGGESAGLGEEVEEFSALCELEDDEGAPLFWLVADLDLGLRTVVDHIDEVAVVEFAEEVGLDPVGGLLAGPGEIDLESVELRGLAAEIDTR